VHPLIRRQSRANAVPFEEAYDFRGAIFIARRILRSADMGGNGFRRCPFGECVREAWLRASRERGPDDYFTDVPHTRYLRKHELEEDSISMAAEADIAGGHFSRFMQGCCRNNV